MKPTPTYLPPEIAAAFKQAAELRTAGRLLEAETIYRSLAVQGAGQTFALEGLADLYIQQHRVDEAQNAFRKLVEVDPDNLHYCAQLANQLNAVGKTQEAIEEYERILRRKPRLAIAHYNVALLYAQLKKYPEAIKAYKKAAEFKIERVEEVYSNMGVLYSEMQEPDKAVQAYERALKISPQYVPALFNYAGHLEESDDKDTAIERYEHILTIDPKHWKSLARLAYPRRISDETSGLVERLEAATLEPKENPLEQEGLYFALGKALDDLQEFDRAADAYNAANKIGKQRSAHYDKQSTEQGFTNLIEMFDRQWIESNTSDNDARPLFICGMFRSGSTLLEQMLGAHSSVTVGGEIEVLPWLVGTQLTPYPQGVKSASPERLHQIGNEYLARVRELFPDYTLLTDKRPDNYLHIGLIRAMFPQARIIHTRRGVLDNCLSLYFQQLGHTFSYATDLENTAHYIHQHDRLMAHWHDCLPADDIFTVNYEELVENPEPLMRRLLEYVGLDWDPQVLEFQKKKSVVKTPSLWQVREKLHTRSRERWRNYESLVEPILPLAAQRDGEDSE